MVPSVVWADNNAPPALNATAATSRDSDLRTRVQVIV
jgi:hypothetical protein